MANVDIEDQEDLEETVQEGPLFKKFSEIENTYREKAIEAIYTGGFHKLEWVVLEKVHGSNFCFITDGSKIECAKRTSLLSSDPNEKQFHNHLALTKKYEKSILQAFEMVKAQINPELTVLRIFGEIFGGLYPHKEVPKSSTAGQAVQKGLYYCPDIDFYAFDLHDGKYIDYDHALKIFQQCGFVHAVPLATGSFEEVLKYPNTFVTTVPKLYNLPEIPDNIAEGVVLKPIKNAYFHTGSRVILKNKTEKFVEKVGGKVKIPKDVVPGPKLTPEGEKLMQEMLSLITASRLESVISKIGEVTIKDFGKLMSLYTKDVLNEFNKDWESDFATLTTEQQKLITRALGTESTKIIKEYFAKEQNS